MSNLPYLLIQFCSLLRRAVATESKEVIKRREEKIWCKYWTHYNYWRLVDISSRVNQPENKRPWGGLIRRAKIFSLHIIIFASDFILAMTN